MENPGKNFYLVSGLSQARYIFILSLMTNVINGELLEAPSRKPWPDKLKNSKEFVRRIQRIDIGMFTRFKQVYQDKFNAYRIRFNIDDEVIKIDNEPWKLRSGSACSYFRFFLVLAVLRLYGENNAMTKKIQKKIYETDTVNNVWRAKKIINEKIALITAESALPIKEIIVKNENGYIITDNLNPFGFMIKIEGDMKPILERYFSKTKINKYFSLLPR